MKWCNTDNCEDGWIDHGRKKPSGHPAKDPCPACYGTLERLLNDKTEPISLNEEGATVFVEHRDHVFAVSANPYQGIVVLDERHWLEDARKLYEERRRDS